MSLYARPLVSWLDGWSVFHNVLQDGGKLHFHAPIGALVFSMVRLFAFIPKANQSLLSRMQRWEFLRKQESKLL